MEFHVKQQKSFMMHINDTNRLNVLSAWSGPRWKEPRPCSTARRPVWSSQGCHSSRPSSLIAPTSDRHSFRRDGRWPVRTATKVSSTKQPRKACFVRPGPVPPPFDATGDDRSNPRHWKIRMARPTSRHAAGQSCWPILTSDRIRRAWTWPIS